MWSKILVAIVLAVLSACGVPVAAQSPSELLEKGIYIEETVGQVDRAIEIYNKIIDDAAANRPHVAEALFRLGICQLKSGDTTAATEAFERIIADFPEQESFVARARENMPDDPTALEFGPAPWSDGEVMRLGLKLTSGTKIGTFLMSVDEVDPIESDGERLWRLRVRRKVFGDSSSDGISQVIVRQDDMTPVSSLFKHAALGHFEAEYGDGNVKVTTVGPDTTREQPIVGSIFDNEEGFHLFRILPLQEGYKKTASFLAPWAGGATPVEFEITKREMIKVPAGEFECFRMEFSVPQTFWYSTDPSHVLVKFEAGGVIAELEDVYVQEPGQDVVYRDDEREFSVTTPPDWLFYEVDDQLLLLDPMVDTQASLEVRTSGGGADSCAFQTEAYRRLEECRGRYPAFELREGTWSEREIAGWPAVGFVGDYKIGDDAMVYYWTFIESGPLCVGFTFKVPGDRFDGLRDELEAIVESYDGPPPPPPADPVESGPTGAVRTVISDFHLAASRADAERYLDHVAPDLVFLGTDSSERFDAAELRALVESSFSTGEGWVAEPSDPNVVVSDDGTIAWFDERLHSRKFGELRASGILRKDDGRWRIVHYAAGFPVPNALVADLAAKIEALDKTSVDDVVGAVSTESGDDPAAAVKAVLRDFHLAASEADGDRFFGHLAPDAITYGTDRTERKSLERLRAFTEPYLSRGIGWTSVPVEQNAFLAPNGRIAWFDERLTREGVGQMRSTGVLRKIDGTWKIAYFNLVILVPNELAEDLVERIRSFYEPR